MKKNTKIISWIGGVLLVLGVLVLIANIYLEKKIKTAIQDNLKAQKISYNEVSFSLLARNSSIINPKLQKEHFTFSANKISLQDLDYTQYIFHHKIVIDNLEILKPKFVIRKTDSVSPSKTDSTSADPFSKNILFKNIKVRDGLLKFIKNDTTRFYGKIGMFTMNEVRLSAETFKNKLPFKYKNMELVCDSIYYKLSNLHYLTVSNLNLKNKELNISNLKILSTYNKVDFQKHISVEHDRFNLAVKSIVSQNFKWQFANDSLQLQSSFTAIKNGNLELYRNKLLPDDNSTKPLYSKQLRESGVKMKFDSLQVTNSRIVYEEKVAQDREAGKVIFGNVNANISNVQNMNMNSTELPKTRVHATAQFMDKSPLTLNWEFLVNDIKDKFHVWGNMGHLSADEMNSFLTSFKNIKAEGEIESLAYNFYGDQNNASGDMNLKYKNFRVKVLKKNSKEKNSLLTGIVNLFVKNHAQNNQIENRGVTAQRDVTKSFWNYIWTFIRNGALKSFIKF